MHVQTNPVIVFSIDEVNSSLSIPAFNSEREIYFISTPIEDTDGPTYVRKETKDHVIVMEPHLPSELSVFDKKEALKQLVEKFIQDEKIEDYSIVSDTPKFLPVIRNLKPKTLIYNCIQDYSATHPVLEQEMIVRADVVLNTGHVYLN